TDKSRALAFHCPLDLDHVRHRYALGDTDHQLKPRIDALEDRVGGERRRYENRRSCGAGGAHGVRDGVENGNLILKLLPPFARGDTGNDLGAVLQTELRMPCAECPSNALDEHPGLRRY